MSTDGPAKSVASHVVALDGSEDADRAFMWALRNLVPAKSCCWIRFGFSLSILTQPKQDKLIVVHGLQSLPLENPHMVRSSSSVMFWKLVSLFLTCNTQDWVDQATTVTREERSRLAKERHRALFSHYERRCKEAGVCCLFAHGDAHGSRSSFLSAACVHI